MSIELKIKSKHLALEAKVIRFEERKLLKQLRWMRKHQKPLTEILPLEMKINSLNYHRRSDVRSENRATFLARAYIAGKPYKSVEAKVKSTTDLNHLLDTRVASMVAKYGNDKVSYVWKDGRYQPDPEALKELKLKLRAWSEA